MAAPDLDAGTRIDRYSVVRRVGSGARGVVYEARDQMLGRTVALKLLIHESNERARREADALARLHHPHIVQILDVVEHEGRLGLVQQWVDGRSLEQVLAEQGTLSLAETVRLGVELCEALGTAHRAGVLHRDLKPSNVLRAATSFMLTDFGAFGELRAETSTTRAGEIAGTPLWMSPEQITGEPQSVASDIYGLGLLLFRCLYGELPGGEASSFIELAMRRTRETIEVPSSPLQPLIRRCLAREPSTRPASVEEVRAALLEAMPSEPDTGAEAAAPQSQTRPTQGLEAAAGVVVKDELARSPDRRSRAPMVGIATAAAVVAIVLWLLVQATGVVASLVAAGLLVGGLTLAAWLRRRWTRGEPQAMRKAAGVVLGEVSRADLSTSLMIELTELTGRLQTLGAEVIGHTVVALAKEYDEADDPATRIAALQQLLALQERIEDQLTPWHVRHKESIALLISVVSCAAGVASVVLGFVRA
jgi:hypothetical protein